MIGVVIVSHGDLARALVDSTSMLVGTPEQLSYTGIYPGDAPEEFYGRLVRCVEEVDTGDGVVVLVDLYGGTPNNNVARLSREKNIRIVTGANLPMAMYVCMERTQETTLREMVDGLIATGTEGISEFDMSAKAE